MSNLYVHNASEYGFETDLFAFWDSGEGFSPNITLIWSDSFESAYETYVQEAAPSHTLEEAQEIWDDVDFEAKWEAGTLDYFDLNDQGELVHTEMLDGREVGEDEATYLTAAILSVHEASEEVLLCVAFQGSQDDLDARRLHERLRNQGYDAVLTRWDTFGGASKQIRSITAGRMTDDPYDPYYPTSEVVWLRLPDEEDEDDEPIDFGPIGQNAHDFVIPPPFGAALFFLPGPRAEQDMVGLQMEGMDVELDPIHRSSIYDRWILDPTVKINRANFGPGAFGQLRIDFEDLEALLVAQDQLMALGARGFVAVWPTLDGRVWQESPYKWKLLEGHETLERARSLVIDPDRSKVRYVFGNPTKPPRRKKNKLKAKLLR